MCVVLLDGVNAVNGEQGGVKHAPAFVPDQKLAVGPNLENFASEATAGEFLALDFDPLALGHLLVPSDWLQSDSSRI